MKGNVVNLERKRRIKEIRSWPPIRQQVELAFCIRLVVKPAGRVWHRRYVERLRTCLEALGILEGRCI